MKLKINDNLTSEQRKKLKNKLPTVFIGDVDPAIWVDPGAMGDDNLENNRIGPPKIITPKELKYRKKRR